MRARAVRARGGIAPTSGGISIGYGLADLEDLDAVRAFAHDFCATHDRLDVLIQNAGGIHPGFGTDTAGTELTIVGQVVAPFLLIRLLMSALGRLSAKLEAPPASAFTAATEYSRPR